MIKIDPALTASDIKAYTDVGFSKKAAFHSKGKAFMRKLAAELGLVKGSFDVRSNMGGIAVSGEITLHSDSLYVQLSESCMHRGGSLLYRSCKGRKDYTGGPNHFEKMADLKNERDFERFFNFCKQQHAEMEVLS